MDISRRLLLAGSASMLLGSTVSDARAYALSAAPDLITVLDQMDYIVEGRGPAIVRVLFTPWCSATPELYRRMRDVTSNVRLHWIPHAGGQPEGREATQAILASGTPEAIAENFVTLRPFNDKTETRPAPLSDRQDSLLASAYPTIVRETGRGLVSPTLAWMIAGERVRYVPGQPRDDLMEIMIRTAS